MRELILVRHGEPTHVRDGLTGGWTDSALTELGRVQAAATGGRLAEMFAQRPFAFYSSDLRRARETAEIISEHVGIPALLESGLREFNNGEAANKTLAETEGMVTTPPEAREAALDWAPYPGSETWRTMTVRVGECLDTIAREAASTALIVSHGGSGQAVITWWLGLTDLVGERAIAFDLDLCSITHLTLNRWEERTITKLNDMAHLAGIGP